jgi:hypothetical protein
MVKGYGNVVGRQKAKLDEPVVMRTCILGNRDNMYLSPIGWPLPASLPAIPAPPIVRPPITSRGNFQEDLHSVKE